MNDLTLDQEFLILSTRMVTAYMKDLKFLLLDDNERLIISDREICCLTDLHKQMNDLSDILDAVIYEGT